jgi:hypothetical protein
VNNEEGRWCRFVAGGASRSSLPTPIVNPSLGGRRRVDEGEQRSARDDDAVSEAKRRQLSPSGEHVGKRRRYSEQLAASGTLTTRHLSSGMSLGSGVVLVFIRPP